MKIEYDTSNGCLRVIVDSRFYALESTTASCDVIRILADRIDELQVQLNCEHCKDKQGVK